MCYIKDLGCSEFKRVLWIFYNHIREGVGAACISFRFIVSIYFWQYKVMGGSGCYHKDTRQNCNITKVRDYFDLQRGFRGIQIQLFPISRDSLCTETHLTACLFTVVELFKGTGMDPLEFFNSCICVENSS